jgi:phage baseplate assembly protein gpV
MGRLRVRNEGLETWLWCYRLRAPPGARCWWLFQSWEEVVVVVVNSVDDVDGGCAGVVRSDVADNGDSSGLVAVS